MSRDTSLGIATSCELEGSFRLPTEGRFSLLHRVQIGSGAKLASYPVGTAGSTFRVKVTGA
jgi:hypothetical protein